MSEYFPYEFRYMGTEWKIRLGKVGRDQNGLKYLGRVLWSNNEIRINSGLNGTAFERTLWHEIFHIILGEHSDTQAIDPEELICRLSSGMIHILQENPWLRRTMKGDICQ